MTTMKWTCAGGVGSFVTIPTELYPPASIELVLFR
jgi:hypothetical protein